MAETPAAAVPPASTRGAPDLRTGLVGVGLLALVLVAGLAWAKWLPYLAKSEALAESRTWAGSVLFASAGAPGEAPTLAGAWDFTVAYFAAVWKALVVALLVAAAVEALVPRGWLLGVLARPSRLGQSAVGALLSVPSMMCTCCTAPVTVGLRRQGAPLAASLAYWLGNPLLNPAVLVFLALVLPWQYAAARLVVGIVLVVLVTSLLARALEPRLPAGAAASPPYPLPAAGVRALPGRYGRALTRFALVLVPEYVVIVLATGLLVGPLSDFVGVDRRLGAVALVFVAAAAVLLVVPTGGEIPVIVAVTAAGAGTGLAGVLLIALPALSLPSMVLVGRTLGWRATWSAAGAVVLGSLLAGALLAAAG